MGVNKQQPLGRRKSSEKDPIYLEILLISLYIISSHFLNCPECQDCDCLSNAADCFDCRQDTPAQKETQWSTKTAHWGTECLWLLFCLCLKNWSYAIIVICILWINMSCVTIKLARWKRGSVWSRSLLFTSLAVYRSCCLPFLLFTVLVVYRSCCLPFLLFTVPVVYRSCCLPFLLFSVNYIN